MRRALGIAAGLALIAAALSPLPTAQASCLSATGEYQARPLIGIEVAARTTPPALERTGLLHPRPHPDHTMTLTPSFAPYWGAFWVRGRSPRSSPRRRTPEETS